VAAISAATGLELDGGLFIVLNMIVSKLCSAILESKGAVVGRLTVKFSGAFVVSY
jgi:hypothetical protein